jgi:hypothetical protein
MIISREPIQEIYSQECSAKRPGLPSVSTLSGRDMFRSRILGVTLDVRLVKGVAPHPYSHRVVSC